MEKNLNDLLTKHGIDRDHTVTFDGSDKKSFRLESVFMECGSFSLFDEDNKKAVIIKNPYFLTKSGKDSEKIQKTDSDAVKSRKEKEAAKKEGQLELLDNYLKDPDPNTAVIFYCDAFDADSRKKEYKMMQKYEVKIINFIQMNDREFDSYMNEQIKKNGYHLTPEAIKELKDRVDIDTMKLHNAFEKMDLYGEKNLNEEDIKHIVPMNSTVNAFKLASMFIQGNLAEVIKAKDEMLSFNYDYNAMIMMIASRLRSLYNMKHLYEQGLNEDSIAVRLHANPWAVKFGLQDCRSMKSEKLLSYLSELAELDQGIKAGLTDPKDGFEQFLLRNGKRN
jgi:DNA polymerase III, delta subunit